MAYRAKVKKPRMPLRNHFRFDGKPKRAFESKQHAFTFAQANGLHVQVYKCDFCNKYHLASV